MKVGMYYNNRDVRLEEAPVPEVGDGDVLFKVVASGICGSDLMEWYRIKKAPLVLGHVSNPRSHPPFASSIHTFHSHLGGRASARRRRWGTRGPRRT